MILGLNGNMGHVQVGIRILNLTEGIVKTFSKRAFKFCKEGVGVTILTYCFLLRLTKLVFGVRNLFFLVFQNLPQ